MLISSADQFRSRNGQRRIPWSVPDFLLHYVEQHLASEAGPALKGGKPASSRSEGDGQMPGNVPPSGMTGKSGTDLPSLRVRCHADDQARWACGFAALAANRAPTT